MATLAPTRRSMELRALLAQHQGELEAVFEQYGLAHVRVFGSVARGDADDESDVDLLFECPEGMGLLTMSRVERELSEILGVAVDLVPETALLTTARANVEKDARPL
ncbi:nucleotidyltransferase family protein [Aeromicrobium sp. YIM 150415]|uniref:nucleotidyltransferase family protein n=1 Tax=Aeromicrobium sp. YIM 150415 TaxID=2803912 RepID=UPI001962A132|nr:nucleotidyltransferase family protein [Aeromicrobium sp. YIM 150415]MBM9464919.1 nucleotidyltransferase family protein [Aeromicrobium sp. YIM 150415]